jgi:hypothetical protein
MEALDQLDDFFWRSHDGKTMLRESGNLTGNNERGMVHLTPCPVFAILRGHGKDVHAMRTVLQSWTHFSGLA